MYLVFALIAVLTLFFMLAWVIVTVSRLCFPEKPLPLDRDPVMIRHRAMASGESVPVGVREIREDQQRYRVAHRLVPYVYLEGGSDGFPAAWREDLWRRRN